MSRAAAVINTLAEDASSGDPMARAEVMLAAAVIETALVEGCKPPSKPDGRPQGSGFHARPHEREEAWAFLTNATGRWARSREDWCIQAGFDPETIMQAALKRGPHPMLVEYWEQQRERQQAAVAKEQAP